MLQAAALALPLLATLPIAVTAAEPLKIDARAWCENSLRLDIAPSVMPASAAPTVAARAAMLKQRGLAAMPDALSDVGTCQPGPASKLGTPLTNGNLRAAVGADRASIVFTAVDTGKTLFSASTTFVQQQHTSVPVSGVCTPGRVVGHDLGSLVNTTIDAAIQHCGKILAGCAGFSVRGPACFGGQIATVQFLSGAPEAGASTSNDTEWTTWTKPGLPPGYLIATTTVAAGDKNERIYGLGQGGWTQEGGCPSGPQEIVPLERNGQTVSLQQRKYHVTIPFVYSSAGYGFLFNMPGAGTATIGVKGTGGMTWQATAALGLSIWVTALPANASGAGSIYKQYADATGHAPPLREEAMLFWQSRNRYKSSAIALSVADRLQKLDLPVGVLVVDYNNEAVDGDYAPNPGCFPSLSNLSASVRAKLNATTMFSFWPEAKNGSAEFSLLVEKQCVINADLGGYAIDTTREACRNLIWGKFLKPRYYDQGVSSYWLDETDGEGTGIGNGDYGYDTSFGPAAAYTNLWVGSYLSTFSDPVKALGGEPPLVLTRGTWAGGQKHGIVLWSSDTWSTFEELASQVPQGVHASLSGIPWWTTDVGGYGCGNAQPNHSPYMQELIVRWYEFGCWSPVFRTHGCRSCSEPECQQEPDVAPCAKLPGSNANVAGSCAANEPWSYGAATQKVLEKYIRLRASLLPYIQELDRNVTTSGVPTARPLWWEFPDDDAAVGVNTQYMLGPDYMVAPVVVQNATNRSVYFPGDQSTKWYHVLDGTVVQGGQTLLVAAPLESIPVYTQRSERLRLLVWK